jgi:hypothetical protein
MIVASRPEIQLFSIGKATSFFGSPGSPPVLPLRYGKNKISGSGLEGQVTANNTPPRNDGEE